MLGRYQSNPRIEHWTTAKKVLRYLQGTKDYKLIYQRSNNLEVVGYSNSYFSGCVYSHRSTSGYIFMMANGAISWRSAKQSLVATSTMEAEFISLFEATSQGIWLKSFMANLQVIDSVPRLLKIYCDNLAIVFLAKNNKSESRSKHIDIKYLVMRERVKANEMIIENISIELMIANPWTKGMQTKSVRDHVKSMELDSVI